MTSKIKLLADATKCREHTLQYVPASTEFSGTEEVSTYFTKAIEENKETSFLEVTLRGRPLDGHVLQLPENVKCMIVQSGRSNNGDDGGKVWMEAKRLDSFTYWNYDRHPSSSDQLKQALEWMELAEVLHDDTTEKEKHKE